MLSMVEAQFSILSFSASEEDFVVHEIQCSSRKQVLLEARDIFNHVSTIGAEDTFGQLTSMPLSCRLSVATVNPTRCTFRAISLFSLRRGIQGLFDSPHERLGDQHVRYGHRQL